LPEPSAVSRAAYADIASAGVMANPGADGGSTRVPSAPAVAGTVLPGSIWGWAHRA